MDSFDQSLKYLLQKQPADFVHFALQDPNIRVMGPVSSGLPSRSRDIDGAYFIERAGDGLVAHFEFHRRHQSARELAVYVAEAQIRLYRRESREVVSLVWDLYGAIGEPVIDERTLAFGAKVLKERSTMAYLRINLRGMPWKAFMAQAPPALWPLVTLAQGGASEEAMREAKDAIEARGDLTASEQADHLAVLWFIAEAEDVPVRAMKEYITKERLMASTLYQSIFEDGEARGKAQQCADTIVKILVRQLGSLDPALAVRIRSVSSIELLEEWLTEALDATDAEAARRLVDKISQAPLSSAA